MSTPLLPPSATDVIADLNQRVTTLEQASTDQNAPVDLYNRVLESYAFADTVTPTLSSASPFAVCDQGFRVGFCQCR